MKPFRCHFSHFSIRGKIIAITLLTSTLALLLACLAFFVNEAVSVRKMLEKDLSTQAEVMASNCGAALAFNDPGAAEEILRTLGSKPHVLGAYLLAADDRVFARYRNPRYLPAVAEEFDSWLTIGQGNPRGEWRDDRLFPLYQTVGRPVVVDGERIGSVFIASDLSPLYDRLSFYAAISLLVMTIASSVAYLLASKLQKRISEPIMELTAAMTSVARGEDYSIRSSKLTDDEIGVLIDHFNTMLARIEERDLLLKDHGEHLRKLAHFDPLTELPNRVLIFDRLAQAILQAGRTSRNIAVLFIDLDHFKDVNDSLGHRVGDQLLREFSGRLRDLLRESDGVGRLGGDEFIVFLPEDPDDLENVGIVAHKIIDSCAQPFLIEGREVFITGSIGITVYPFDGETVDELVKNADLAMYAVKERGKNHFQFFSQDMQERASHRLELHNRVRRALDRDEFTLHYQPKIDLASRTVCGAEALVRWDSPEEGLIPPERFLPMAEETGLIIQIGEWVLRSVCRQIGLWQKEGRRPLRVAVNISPILFKRQNLAEKIGRILEYSGIDPDNLELEIDETALMNIDEGTVSTLWALKEMGLHIAIDHFGTGYSALSFLKRLPIDTLKIDRSFIHAAPGGKEEAYVIRAILTLGQSLHLRVAAEGVETEEQLEFLRENGCDEIQGLLCGPPVSPQECSALCMSGTETAGGKVTRLQPGSAP